MRTFVAAIAMLAMLTTAACAADDSPVVGKFPDTKSNCHNYLFMLKKNGISVPGSPQEFCAQLGYGKAVLFNSPTEEVENHKVVPGKLEWVICQFAEHATGCP
jgi:hypothetical protein